MRVCTSSVAGDTTLREAFLFPPDTVGCYFTGCVPVDLIFVEAAVRRVRPREPSRLGGCGYATSLERRPNFAGCVGDLSSLPGAATDVSGVVPERRRQVYRKVVEVKVGIVNDPLENGSPFVRQGV